MSKFTLGQPIKIDVQTPNASGIVVSKKALRFSKKKPDIFPRLLKKGLINFYDLGQIKSGDTWIDIPYSSLFDATSYSWTFNYQFRENHWHDLADLITEVPTSQWKTQYRKITYEDGEKYGIDLRDMSIDGPMLYSVGKNETRKDGTGALITGHDWSAKGLKINTGLFTMGANNFAFQDWGLFYFFDHNLDFTKITKSYDPTAAAVSFTLEPFANVFLMPRPISMRAKRLGTLTAFGQESWTMFAPYRPISREFWLDRTNGSDFLPNIFSYNETNITLDSTNSAALIAYMLADPLTVIRRTQWPSSTPVITGPANPGGWENVFFETACSDQAETRIDMSIVADPSSNVSADYHPIVDGILVGVIEQGSTFYYFWRTAGGGNYIEGGGPVHTFTLT